MSRKPVSTLSVLFVILAFGLGACGPSATPSPTIDVDAVYTQAVQTIVAGYTQTAEAMPTATPLPPTDTPLPPTDTVEPTNAPTPTSLPAAGATAVLANPKTAVGCYNAALVYNVSVPYNTRYNPGDTFTKTWHIMNTGTCDWTPDFKITFVGGNVMGSDTTKIRQKVGAGYAVDISVPMTAPDGTGSITGNWQMATDSGTLFGEVFTVTILLPGGAGGTNNTGGCYNAALVEDVPIDGGNNLNAGDTFSKSWVIKNTGSCDWNSDFRIVFVGGDYMADTTKIRQKVGAGSSATITVKNMVAPSDSGKAVSSWQMATDNGTGFGEIYQAVIYVK